MAFKEMGGNTGSILKWATPGQVVEGRLVGTKRGKVFNGRPSSLAIIKQANGVDITVPLTTVLESKFLENEIQPGHVVRLTYLGLQPGTNGGPQYKGFKLEVDDAGVQAAVPQQAQQQYVPAPAAAQPAAVAAPASEYDSLAGQLAIKAGAAAAPMLSALLQMYPDPAVRLEQLKTACRAQGIKV